MKDIDFAKIEKKWQDRWEKEKVFKVSEDSKKEKYYVLEMFPYPSSSGLHIGHAFNYSIGDIYARYKRMNGFNVLYPMGFDSFGLPAENAAKKANAHPKDFTEEAIGNYVRQMKALGLSYDWDRMIETHKPEYYRWDQWIFLKMFEKGLAYKKESNVNWCPECETVLANEQVINGKCWRHDNCDVEVKSLDQWFLKTTEYADELYDGVDKLEDWPQLIKKLQKNWIGKSEGTEVNFEVNGEDWPVFTTRVDTLMGVTFLVVSAQHSKLGDLVSNEQKKEVENFVKKIHSVKEEDIDKLDKEGVFSGSYAKHPLTGEDIPIWVGNFVLAEYGSGMVMAVPAHDQRDFDFANKYGLEIKRVISEDGSDSGSEMTEAFTAYGVLVNSGGFDDLKSAEAKEHIANALEIKKKGKKTVNYRLRDWLISRQRFWGTPIPIVYCDECGVVPVKEKDLPVELPSAIDFSASGNALESSKGFLETSCPKCGSSAKRETDTMDTFVNSSWYFFRYMDPKNSEEIFGKKSAKYWSPVDKYIGGKEHATLHLIYSRFYTKFLRDLGLVEVDEPAKSMFNQGFVLGPDGEKMSKSKGNIILPETVSDKFGQDSARLFLVSLASPDKDRNWSDDGAEGSLRFIRKVFDFVVGSNGGKSSKRAEHKINLGIRDFTKHLENFDYNLAVISLRKMFEDIFEEELLLDDMFKVVKLLSPICPHIAEELWEKIGGDGFVSLADWPEADESKIDEGIEKAEKAVEKTIGDVKNILGIIEEKENREAKKVYIYVIPPELANYNSKLLGEKLGLEVEVFAANDSKKVDPEGKAGKAKPGKPGIYVE